MPTPDDDVDIVESWRPAGAHSGGSVETKQGAIKEEDRDVSHLLTLKDTLKTVKVVKLLSHLQNPHIDRHLPSES